MGRFINAEQTTSGADARMLRLLVCWSKDERGATAVEYGLIAACIFLGVVSSAYLFGDNMSSMFNSLSSTINSTLH